MTNSFINSFESEWLKKKRSLASWLVLIGAFFTPLIVLLVRIKHYAELAKFNADADFWKIFWHMNWKSMSLVLLPMGIILATGLIAQLEYKNNAWKQLNTTPQRFETIFFAKLAVVFVMMIELFILFNLGVYLAAVLPSLFFASAPYPSAPIPYAYFLQENLKYFIDCLPILALQYLLSLQFKNFLVPIGAGFVIWFLGLGMLKWKYSYLFPYLHPGIDFLISAENLSRDIPVNIQALAAVYFVVITAASYILYLTKKEKG